MSSKLCKILSLALSKKYSCCPLNSLRYPITLIIAGFQSLNGFIVIPPQIHNFNLTVPRKFKQYDYLADITFPF